VGQFDGLLCGLARTNLFPDFKPSCMQPGERSPQFFRDRLTCTVLQGTVQEGAQASRLSRCYRGFEALVGVRGRRGAKNPDRLPRQPPL
jgi:hypothetical protein